MLLPQIYYVQPDCGPAVPETLCHDPFTPGAVLIKFELAKKKTEQLSALLSGQRANVGTICCAAALRYLGKGPMLVYKLSHRLSAGLPVATGIFI